MSALTALAIGAMVTLTPIGATSAEQVHVRDGDTLVLAGTPYRLVGVQAPERGQALYVEAQRAMGALVSSGEVACHQRGNETSYDRLVGFCTVNGQDVSEVMLRAGLVCVWKRYHPPPQYLVAEQEAKLARVGMWALPRAQRNRVCR